MSQKRTKPWGTAVVLPDLWRQELDSMILMDPFHLGIFCDLLQGWEARGDPITRCQHCSAGCCVCTRASSSHRSGTPMQPTALAVVPV